MAGICITCLATQNLIDMKEKDWTVFDLLLHPISKQYSSIRFNLLVKICIKCQCSMHRVEQFRTTSMRNFLYLMNLWNVSKTSTNAPGYEPSNVEPADIKPQPLWHTLTPTHTPAANQYKHITYIPTSSTAVDTNKIKTEETCSSKETVVEIETVMVKIEQQDDLEETDIVTEVTVKQESPDVYSGQEECITDTNQTKDNTILTNTPNVQCELKDPPKVTLNIPKVHIKSTNASPSASKEKTKYSCKNCDKTYELLKELNFHNKRVHIGTPVDCTQCGKTCRNEYCLRRHMINVHSEKTYCEVCNKYFAFTSYKKHLKNSPKHNNPDQLKATRVTCEMCKSTLRDKHELKQHMRTHTEAKYCQPCDKWFPPRSYKNHIKQSLKHISREDYNLRTTRYKYCQPCDKWFPPRSYKNHIKQSLKHISREDYKFTCHDCNEKFLTKTSMRDHILFAHLKINPFKCPVCAMEFKNHTTRSRHRRLVHENKPSEKKYVCVYCGKAWHTPGLLRDHMSTHTGEKPHKCDKCDATFGQKPALIVHKRQKHENQSGHSSTRCPAQHEHEKEFPVKMESSTET
ncbi:hypothetical protein O0L34_g15722 [Tuta absoluta]|nr:hypothetical protein O0L34_g15722 [Tuta absoluta]